MEKTIYGRKKPGQTKFIVIAPHAAGDDLKSGLIARKIATKLSGYLIINRNFKKHNNSNSHKYETEDFNKLRWSVKKDEYLWSRKNPAMKKFFDDIAKYNEDAKKKTGVQKTVNIYIHSFTSEKSGIDLGAGLRPGKFKKKLFGSRKHFSIGSNSGDITVKIGDLKKIKILLEKKLSKDYDLEVTIGESFSGWSRQSAIQFHKCGGRNDYALQIEISQKLRKTPQDIQYIVDLLAGVLDKIFINN